MNLSDAQSIPANTNVNMFVTACPGAGKTRVVAAKIQREIVSASLSGREVGCITYTNAARDEISARCRSSIPARYLQSVRISTLHGFLLEAVLKPFSYLLPEFATGIHLATPRELIFEEALAATGGVLKRKVADFRGSCESYFRGLDGLPVSRANRSAVREFIKQLELRSSVDFEGVVYHSYRLLSEFESTRIALSHQFSWILVDEYQDLNPPALGMLEILAASGKTKLFLIGDLAQMVYEFRGVTLDSLDDCARNVNALRLRLNETYRCGPKISAVASNLELGKLNPVGDAACLSDKVAAASGTLKDILAAFVSASKKDGIPLQQCAVLGRNGDAVDAAVGALMDLGHRACRMNSPDRSKWFKIIAQRFVAAWRDGSSGGRDNADAVRDAIQLGIDSLDLQQSCKLTTDTIHAEVHFGSYQPDLDDALKLVIGSIVNVMERILIADRVLTPLELAGFRDACRQQYRLIAKEEQAFFDTPCGVLAEMAEPRESVRCMTIHIAKGLEFDAVLLLDCEQGELPFCFENSTTYPNIEGDRRMFFVAITRAKLFFQASYSGVPSQFLEQVGMV